MDNSTDQDIEDLLDYAMDAFHSGKLPETVVMLTDILERDPKCVNAYPLIVNSLTTLFRHEEAKRFSKIFYNVDKSGVALEMYAKSCYITSDNDGFKKALGVMLASVKVYSYSLYLFALMALDVGLDELAENLMQKADDMMDSEDEESAAYCAKLKDFVTFFKGGCVVEGESTEEMIVLKGISLLDQENFSECKSVVASSQQHIEKTFDYLCGDESVDIAARIPYAGVYTLIERRLQERVRSQNSPPGQTSSAGME